jgi:transcriptional regulator with XRE-family HTH domain
MKGFRMKELRKLAGLTQGEVAAELGLHNVTVCNWEKSERELLRVYAEAFERLVNDVERVAWIKASRRQRRRAGRFSKGMSE